MQHEFAGEDEERDRQQGKTRDAGQNALERHEQRQPFINEGHDRGESERKSHGRSGDQAEKEQPEQNGQSHQRVSPGGANRRSMKSNSVNTTISTPQSTSGAARQAAVMPSIGSWWLAVGQRESPALPGHQPAESNHHQISQHVQNASRPARQAIAHEIDAQMRVPMHAGRRAEAHDVDDQQQRELLDPGRRVVENVAAVDQPAEAGHDEYQAQARLPACTARRCRRAPDVWPPVPVEGSSPPATCLGSAGRRSGSAGRARGPLGRHGRVRQQQVARSWRSLTACCGSSAPGSSAPGAPCRTWRRPASWRPGTA